MRVPAARMADQQCGLCLSCGAPFLPDIDEVDFFNREGNLSMLFLNTQFKQNSDIQRMYNVPKLCSERQASHMIHEAYHQTALDFMCNVHVGDRDVGIFGAVAGLPAAPPPVLPPNQLLARAPGAAFLYYHVASTRSGPQAATWARPAPADRIDFVDLLAWLIRKSRSVTAKPVAQSLKQTYDICQGCNALMTQKSHFRFILGLRGAGRRNSRGVLLPRPVIRQYDVRPAGVPLERGYGRWHIAHNPRMTAAPQLAKSDSEAPCIAYYLHMCLPHQVAPNNDPFVNVHPPLRASGRALYLQLCWIILEIACLATLLQEGTVTKPRNSKRSHGMHQHRGVLDLYVSYFFWRMIQFEFGLWVNRLRLDFVQWHQKYYCDAKNCPGLLSRPAASGIIGRLMFGNTDVHGRVLLRQICRGLVEFYRVELAPLVLHVCGQQFAPPPGPTVHQYFLPVGVVTVLGDRSLEATRNDFQSALGKFGINALLFRLIDLCEGYPREFLSQLKDFRSSWQWREIERVRLSHPGYEVKSAFRLYYLCSLLNPPDDDGTFLKEVEDQVFAIREYCSPWTSVMSLDAIGAFRYKAIDVALPDAT